MPSVYEETYLRAQDKPLDFWAAAAEPLFWHRRWDTVRDDANPPFFPGYMLYALLDKAMVEFVMRLSRGIRLTLCCRHDFQLRLRDTLALLVNIGQGIVPIWSAYENQHALRPLGDGSVLARREDHVR